MSVPGVSGKPLQVDYGFGNLAKPVARATGREGARAEKDEEVASRSQKPELSAEEQRQIRELQAADRRVRAHEQAHIAAGGELVRGAATFTYATGPDDKRYAIAGEVSIDTSPGRTPQETLPKARHIRETALAPADPSPQDRSVAARAMSMEGDARRELVTLRASESDDTRTTAHSEAYSGVERGQAASLGAMLNVFA